jgi:hypothetical protein
MLCLTLTKSNRYNPPSSGSGVSIPPPLSCDATTSPDIDTFPEEYSAGDLLGDLLFLSGGDNNFKKEDEKTNLEVST